MSEIRHRERCRELEIKRLEFNVKAAEAEYLRQRNLCAPAVVLRPPVMRAIDTLGNVSWIIQLSDVICQGETPDEVYQIFDELWVRGNVE